MFEVAMRSSPTAVVSDTLPQRGRLLESLQQPEPGLPTAPAEARSSPSEGDLEETHSRMDAISGRWTLFASSRNGRPNEFVTSASSSRTIQHCPFCEGNEKETPEPVLVVAGDAEREGASLDCAKGWGIRVIPNKYPAVDPRIRQLHPRGAVRGGDSAARDAVDRRLGFAALSLSADSGRTRSLYRIAGTFRHAGGS